MYHLKKKVIPKTVSKEMTKTQTSPIPDDNYTILTYS